VRRTTEGKAAITQYSPGDGEEAPGETPGETPGEGDAPTTI